MTADFFAAVTDRGHPPYIIAELNSSHFGNLDKAKEMIAKAKECRCDCVKFQSWTKDTLYSKTYYKEQPIMERMVKKFALKQSDLQELSLYARSLGIDFSSTAYSEDEVRFLVEKCQVPFLKIASMEINNYDFLAFYARTGLPLILSTGMASLDEIRKACKIIAPINDKLVLLHCVSLYPTPPDQAALQNIVLLKEEFSHFAIGFSDHSIGTELACAATALGARVIEKHFTLDSSRMGLDNNMAAEPETMANLTAQCRNVFAAMGTGSKEVSDSEQQMRLKMRRSLVLNKDLKAGSIVQKGDLSGLRPGTGISISLKDEYAGRVLACDVKAWELLKKSDFVQE